MNASRWLPLLMCAVALPAVAQEAGAPREGAAAADAAERDVESGDDIVLSDALLGAPIVSDADVTLGTLDDLVVDRDSGRLLAAVLAPSPTARPDGQLVPVPAELLHIEDEPGVKAGTAPPRVRLRGVDAERLLDAPAFERANWPERGDRAWLDRMIGHFGASVADKVAEPERVTVLIGRDVQDAQNDSVGRVSNLAVDLGRREVALALVAEPGAGNSVMAVPYTAMRRARAAAEDETEAALGRERAAGRAVPVAEGEEPYSLGLSRERLASAPRIDRGDLVRVRALARSTENDEFFGVRRRADAARPGRDGRAERDEPARPRGGQGGTRDGGGPRSR